HATGKSREAHAAGNTRLEPRAVRGGTFDLSGPVLDRDATHASVTDEDVRARAVDEYRLACFSRQRIAQAKLVFRICNQIDVCGAADAERDVAGERLVQLYLSEASQPLYQRAVHRCSSSSSTIWPTASTSPAPIVKNTSPGARTSATARADSSSSPV